MLLFLFYNGNSCFCERRDFGRKSSMKENGLGNYFSNSDKDAKVQIQGKRGFEEKNLKDLHLYLK